MDMLTSLRDTLQAYCPRVFLQRMAAEPMVRLTLFSPLHRVYAYTLVPEGPLVDQKDADAAAESLEAPLRGILEELCEGVAIQRRPGLVHALRVAAMDVVEHPLVVRCMEPPIPGVPDVPGSLWPMMRALRGALLAIAAAEERAMRGELS